VAIVVDPQDVPGPHVRELELPGGKGPGGQSTEGLVAELKGKRRAACTAGDVPGHRAASPVIIGMVGIVPRGSFAIAVLRFEGDEDFIDLPRRRDGFLRADRRKGNDAQAQSQCHGKDPLFHGFAASLQICVYRGILYVGLGALSDGAPWLSYSAAKGRNAFSLPFRLSAPSKVFLL
jgi:hypothetical protein